MVQELQFTATGHYYIEIGKHVQSRDSLRSQELEEAKKSIVLYNDWTDKSCKAKENETIQSCKIQ